MDTSMNEVYAGSPLSMKTIAMKYALSCAASFMAESVTYPLDVTKTRLQIITRINYPLKSKTMVGVTWNIVKDEGIRSLFNGLSPAVYRHFIYTGFRMVIYEAMRAAMFGETKDKAFPVWESALCGLVSGAVAQFFASPTDLVKVHMQTEGLRRLHNLPPRFRSTSHVFISLYKSNGFCGLWTGWLANTQRAALVNMAGEYYCKYEIQYSNKILLHKTPDLATYDRMKHVLLKRGFNDNWVLHLIASFVSGVVSAAASTPADVVKTRIMDQLRCSEGNGKVSRKLYTGSYDCLKKICRDEGFFALYKGFVPSYIRSGPWSLVFWLTYEEVRRLVGFTGF